MKICPICKARCFEDMEICYGCMHRFEAEEGSACASVPSLARSAQEVGTQENGSPTMDCGKREEAKVLRVFPEAKPKAASPAHAVPCSDAAVSIIVEPESQTKKVVQEFKLVISIEPCSESKRDQRAALQETTR